MGLSNSAVGGCDAREVISGCKNVIGRDKYSEKNSKKIISFCDELRDYLDFEFNINDIEFLEYNLDNNDTLRRGKSHDVNLVNELKENRKNGKIIEFNRSETYNIGAERYSSVYRKNSNGNYLKLRNFLNSNIFIKIPTQEINFPVRLINKKLIDKDDLVDTTMRYICGVDRNMSLPLFPSSLYTSNITSNPWYVLTGILEQEYIFEVPEGIEVIPLIGYTFSIDGTDIKKSCNLHNLSFLECLRLFLRKKKTVEFTITKPQIWFKPTDNKDLIFENDFTKNNNNNGNNLELQEDQDRYYSHSIIYCTVLSGNVNVVENNDNIEIWWNFETELNNITYNTIHLPLLASLDIGVSKIENWLFSETIKYPKSWIPFVVPKRIISNSTPISVYKAENLLIDAFTFWKCQYFIKSLNIYNTCLMNIANNKFNQDELLNQINKTDISQNYTNIMLTKIIYEDHITSYTVCFSEIFNQFESWRVTHKITSDYCMEMMSLICLNSLITSEYLLDVVSNINNLEFKIQLNLNDQIDYHLEDQDFMKELLFMKFISFLSQILLLKGIALKNLSKYQTREFIIKHLKSRVQNFNFSINEKINLKNTLYKIIKIFENNEIHMKSSQTFVTSLNFSKYLKYKYNEYPIINEIIMSSILFFAEIDRNITFSKFICEKLLKNSTENIQEDILWNNVFNIKNLFEINDFKHLVEFLEYKKDEINVMSDNNNQRLIQSNLYLMNQRLERVFESIQIYIHTVRIKINTDFINFLLPKAVDEVKEELLHLRKGFYKYETNYKEDNKMFSSCCKSKEMNSIPFIHNINITRSDFESLNRYSTENIPEDENNSPGINIKPFSIPSIIFSMARSLINRNKESNINNIQCCNTTKTDFRNLLDLADANYGSYEPPTWSISDKTLSTGNSNFITSQNSDKFEELILDWIKLRCWNFTDSDLRWIDGCRYLGAGEYETTIMQLSPNMTVENIAKRILNEVDHSEVRQSLKNIIFEESSPLILVRNHIIPFGELLLPSPDISHLIKAVKSCKYK